MPRRSIAPRPAPTPEEANRPLTLPQQRFVAEYIIDCNATAAAERAGFSDPSYGRQLITLPHVAHAIASRAAHGMRKAELTAATILDQMMMVASFDLRRILRPDGTYKPPSEWDEETGLCATQADLQEQHETRTETAPDGSSTVTTRITTRTIRVRVSDRQVARKHLAQYFGLLDRHDSLTIAGAIDVGQARADARPALADPARRSALLAFAGLPGDGPVTVDAVPADATPVLAADCTPQAPVITDAASDMSPGLPSGQ